MICENSAEFVNINIVVLLQENLEMVREGFSNIHQQIIGSRKFGVPVVIAINRFR